MPDLVISGLSDALTGRVGLAQVQFDSFCDGRCLGGPAGTAGVPNHENRDGRGLGGLSGMAGDTMFWVIWGETALKMCSLFLSAKKDGAPRCVGVAEGVVHFGHCEMNQFGPKPIRPAPSMRRGARAWQVSAYALWG